MRRGCAHCGWNGHPHLCGCMGNLRSAISSKDIERIEQAFDVIAQRANADECKRRAA